MRVTIFSRRNTTARWRYIADRLTAASEVTIIGLLDDGCSLNIMPSFYKFYHSKNTSDFALAVVSKLDCDEIIKRCRLLRNLQEQFALRLIGAMWLSLEEAIDNLNPDVVLSFQVDFYPSDILYRIVTQRGIHFIGMCAGILKNQMNFSALGEYNFIHQPEKHESDRALEELLQPTFAPWTGSGKYDFSRFFKTKLRWNIRSLTLKLQSLLKLDPLNPEYMTTPKIGDDYYIRWSDWRVVTYLDQKWRERLEKVPFEQRVFVGLQYNPECSTDYWVKDLRLSDWIACITEICRVLTNANFYIFVKDHPAMFGMRRCDVYEKLSQINGVIFVPYDVKSQELIEKCKTTFTWTGTIGIQAALAGRCPVVSTTYYTNDKDFIILDTWSKIATLPETINTFQIPSNLEEIRKRVIKQLCSASVPGGSDWLGFNLHKTDLIATDALIKSLNLYLPNFSKNR